MELPSYVKPFPGWLRAFPFMKYYGGQAIGHRIYLNIEIYNDLLDKFPKVKSIALLMHEEFHLKREKEIGIIKFGIKYLLSPKFRFNEEFLAYKVQMEYLKKHKEIFNTEKIAKYLSGPMYLFSVNYKNAKRLLDDAWEEA